MTFRKILREPFVQFLLIGAALFALYEAVNQSPGESSSKIIEVTPGRIEQLTQIFSRTWQKPPTSADLDGMIEDFVKEEIYYREGRKLGLDQDDTLIRRRLLQKMEFLVEPDESTLTPDDQDLEAYLSANSGKYRIPERIAFRQIYFDPSRRGEQAMADALTFLASIEAGKDARDDAGDPTLLPARIGNSTPQQIDQTFGGDLAGQLVDLPVGQWSGPVRSAYGFHLVLIEQVEPARMPDLDEIRDGVLRDWRDKKRQQIMDERYQAIREEYQIIIKQPDATAGGQE